MKQIVLFILCLLFVIKSAEGKTYVTQDQVVMTENGLFVKKNDGPHAIMQLNCDENGFFYGDSGKNHFIDPEEGFEWKTYVSHKNIELANIETDTIDGVVERAAIMIKTRRGVLVVPQFNWDQEGFFISSYFYADFCPNNHPICRECYKGCSELECDYHFKCDINHE